MEEPITKNQCLTCGKSFDSPQAVRMHVVRMHTEAGRQGYRHSKYPMGSPEWVAENRRKKSEYNRKLRQRYYAEGKDSRGRPKPEGWVPRPRTFNYTKAKVGYRDKLTGAAREAYRLKERAYAKQYTLRKKHQRIQPIVHYADQETPNKNDNTTTTTKTNINYCPKCGFHIEPLLVVAEVLAE